MKQMLRIVGGVLLFIVLIAAIFSVLRLAPTGPTTPYPDELIVIHYNAGMCLGTCPAYDLTITARHGHDGAMKFVPTAYTCETTWKRQVVAWAEIERLLTQFERAEFFTSPHLMNETPYDVPTYEIDASIGGQRATANGELEMMTEQSDAMLRLAYTLEEAANVNGWVTGCSDEERVEAWR